MIRFATYSALVLALAALPRITHAAEVALTDVVVSGTVSFGGPAPDLPIINIRNDKDCRDFHAKNPIRDESVLVSKDGGLKNVFINIRRGVPDGEYPVPEEAVVLDQKGCAFYPRMQAVYIGQKVLVKNSDPFTHNVRSFPMQNRPFNFGQPANTEPRERVFTRTEREPVEVQCDYHKWMRAYLLVVEHPFFGISDEDGKFEIKGLPPGEYRLTAWHESLGTERTDVTVGGENVDGVNFKFESKKR